MEADESGVTAKNTYGGPLLLRTEFGGENETTYEYLYNAHGDVVTLISDGEVVATYCYDSFGNILEQTGEVSNSILYAGYQYDEETGLYYINARMYDPVTARFLQADTYLGATNDPLSLNLYTYCLNNPHKYVDPSGHFAITVAGVLMALRIGVSLFSGWMSAKAEYDRQVAEGDNNTDWTSVLFVGAANAGVSFFSFGAGSGAAMAGTGIKAVVKHVGKAMIREAAIGALTDAGIETTRQLITGTGITNLEYDRITEAGVCGGIAGGVGTLAGAGLQGLLNTRVAKSAIEKLDTLAHKGAKAIKNGFERIARKNGKATTEAITGLSEPRFKMDLQYYAKGDAYQGGTSSKVHGNSKLSTKLQHGYEIYNTETGDVVKTGISGQRMNLNGTSPRANTQVNKLNRSVGINLYDSRIVATDMPNRLSALEWERENALRLWNEGNSMSLHKRPRPWEE